MRLLSVQEPGGFDTTSKAALDSGRQNLRNSCPPAALLPDHAEGTYMATTSAACVLLAALCWGVAGGIGGILIEEGWEPLAISFYRGAIGLAFFLVWLALRPQRSGLSNRRLWFWSAVAGLGVAGNFVFYFLSIDGSSVAVAATLMYCAPVFVYLVSFAFKLEKPTTFKWAAIGVVTLGIVLLTRIYDLESSGVTWLGVGAGVLAGLSYAVFIFGFRFAAPHGSPQAILVIAFAALTSMFIWQGDSDQPPAALSTASWTLFAALGVLGAGLSFTFYVIGLKHTTPVVASILAMVEPVTAALFGVYVLNETLVRTQILGMVLIMLTVTALCVHSSVRSNA